MKNHNGMNKAETLTSFLKRINDGDNPESLRKEAHRLLINVDADDIAVAEQNLINDGYSIQLVQLLCATFMLIGIPEEHQDGPMNGLPDDHILRIVLIEHDLIRYFLFDLSNTVDSISCREHLKDSSLEFRKLMHILQHLTGMKEHFEREDDVIFPFLLKYGRINLCQAMQGDHINIKAELEEFVNLIFSFNSMCFEVFKSKLITITRELLPSFREHLSQEDAILYPIALGMIDEAEIWEKIKKVCDEIGYCGVHL
jgi:DUF438 domain-containing protein